MDGHTVQEISAGANACSVEWCPIPTLQTYVACSTYLLKAPQAQLQQSPNTSSTDAQKRLDVHEGEYGLVDGVDIEQEVAQEEMTAGGRQTRMGTVVVHRVSECSFGLLGHNCGCLGVCPHFWTVPCVLYM